MAELTPPDLSEFPDAPIGTRLPLLEGVKVLDLTRFLAGPYGTMILGDMGAEIVKIESLDGDSTRRTAAYFFEGDGAYFMSTNRNKRSLALDIKSPEGKEILRRLIEESDVVVDNLRESQRAALGLDFESLKAVNPKIVSCSVTGFGSSGPYRNRPAYDIVVEALGGIMALTGPKGGPSVRAGVPIGDIGAGMYAAIGILAGLQSARTTGKGMHIDIGMLDAQVSLLSYLAQYYFVGGFKARHQGGEHESLVTYNTFETSDGSIVTAANTQEMWRALCRVIGRPDIIDDPRFENIPARLAHRQELVDIIQTETRKWKTDDIYQAFIEAEVPAAPINTIEDALKDPQVTARGDVVRVNHRSGRQFLTLASPIKSETVTGPEFLPPPVLGGDSRNVLAELGYSAEEIKKLEESGSVGFGDA